MSWPITEQKYAVIWKSMGRIESSSFIDKVLSLENLLDVNHLFETNEVVQSRKEKLKQASIEAENDGYMMDDRSQALKSFMNSNKRQVAKEEPEEEVSDFSAENNTDKGKRDILKFLIENAPLEEWEADIIGCLREEAYYFLPQRMTKIMNEGWASYWHSTILTQKAL